MKNNKESVCDNISAQDFLEKECYSDDDMVLDQAYIDGKKIYDYSFKELKEYVHYELEKARREQYIEDNMQEIERRKISPMKVAKYLELSIDEVDLLS